MKTIEAFKCEMTGGIYETPRRAASSEFRAMMKRIGGSLPAMGSVNSYEIMNWLASNIESGIYPTVFDRLKEALDYFEANRATIMGTENVDA